MSDKAMHIYPLNDLRDHVVDGGKCWCGAAEDDDGLIIHSAMDQREKFQNGERVKS
ncbi:MAG: hypothetical protein K2Y42_18100 [Hyphomicrobium sp.]|uniref:hypothetical protein n=1 Tax=Hyphomicrobium sp. TaxID=82 RepID=UPI0025C533EF|nr:hypothetical protein [Hyphomicrobium sp.]MBX9864655.1 hypothetical protein [Hyphomicrobium sp.]